MKIFLFVGIALAVASALPAGPQYVKVFQDTVGNYELNVNTNGLTRNEHATADGNLRGSYSYTGPDGIVRTVTYTAGEGGFQVLGDAPAPVQYTPEVAAARAAHLAYFPDLH